MGTVNDTTRSKIVFKKRAHRPWQPSLLEGAIDENSNIIDATAKIQDKQLQENQLEFLQKQLETVLEVKAKERETLSHSLNTIDDHRITLGGFLRPKDILMVTEQASLQKSASLLSELKEKENEIHTITQNLKISQAEEYAKRAESARLIEEKARQNAEEKAIFALRQAQAAAEQAKISEERSQGLEQVKVQLENIVYVLEDKLKTANDELQDLGQKTILEAEQRYKLEQDLRNLASKLKDQQHTNHALEEHRDSLIQKLEAENRARLESEAKLLDALQQVTELEQLYDAAKESYALSLANEKASLNVLEQNVSELQSKIQFLRSDKDLLTVAKQQTEEQLSVANLRIVTMQEIIATERNLRMLFETKLKETLVLLEKSELRRRLESEACKLAEEKAKTTFEQAGKAMLQLLHTPPTS